LYNVYAECNNCGWEGNLEVTGGQLITTQECPTCMCETLERKSSDLYSKIRNSGVLRMGGINAVTTKLESSKYTSMVVECPECKRGLLVLSLKGDKSSKVGKDVCASCGCIFQWERVN